MDTLAGLAAVLRSGGDEDRLLEVVARLAARTLGVAAVAVHVYRPAWDDYVAVVGSGPVPEGALTVPLTASDGRALAILSLDEPPAGAPLAMLSVVAEIAASVIEREQLATEAQRHRAAVEHLMRASSELTTSTSRAEMLRTVCEGIRDALGFEMAGVFLDEQGDGRLVPAAAVGFDGIDDLSTFTAAAVEAMIAPEFLREGCVLIECETARALAAQVGMPTLYTSRNNGRGPRASPCCSSPAGWTPPSGSRSSAIPRSARGSSSTPTCATSPAGCWPTTSASTARAIRAAWPATRSRSAGACWRSPTPTRR